MTEQSSGAEDSGIRRGERDVSLRPVLPDDWRSHREFRLEMLRDAPDAFWFTSEDEAAFDEADWREQIEGAWLIQARDADGILGSAGLGHHWEPERARTATLFGMYVAPRARGRGVGEALVEAVLGEATRRGKDKVVLEVVENNEAAIGLYERCGFVRTGATSPHPRRTDLRELEMEARLPRE